MGVCPPVPYRADLQRRAPCYLLTPTSLSPIDAVCVLELQALGSIPAECYFMCCFAPAIYVTALLFQPPPVQLPGITEMVSLPFISSSSLAGLMLSPWFHSVRETAPGGW